MADAAESKKRKVKDESSAEDLGEEGVGAAAPAEEGEPKKGKGKKAEGVAAQPEFKHEKDSSWAKISDGRNQKRLCVQTFKGMTLVHVREYYEKDGQFLPGKGIALTPEQFETICALKDQTLEAVEKLKKK